MRIAEVSTLYRPVPPAGEGSIETLVHTLTEGLVARGHEVTLYALPESRTSARLRSPVDTSYSNDPRKWEWQLYELYQLSRVIQEAGDYDVIHCHPYSFGLVYCDLVSTPLLHSFHIQPGYDYRFLAERTRNRWLHFSSQFQARGFHDLPRVHVIPYGIEMGRYRVASSTEREDYLLFLGRFIPGKGPLQAIELARKAGLPLKMAAPETDYFRQTLRAEIDGHRVEYVGEVGGTRKADLLARARALVYPLQDPEPFGLVLIEALASGLPVLAVDRGSVSEIIDHGHTGFLGRTVDDLVQGLHTTDTLDRAAIRRVAEARFSAEVFVSRLERLLLEMVAEAQR